MTLYHIIQKTDKELMKTKHITKDEWVDYLINLYNQKETVEEIKTTSRKTVNVQYTYSNSKSFVS